MKNRDFRPISRSFSEIVQDRAIVTMEGKQETVPKLSNGTSFNKLSDLAKYAMTRSEASRGLSATAGLLVWFVDNPQMETC